MNQLLDSLRERGCAIDEAMERFVHDELLYEQCLEIFLNDETFDTITELLHNHQTDRAFAQSHMLRGVAANLGIRDIEELLIQIVEPLREGRDEGLLSRFELVLQKRDKYKGLLNECIC